MESTSTLQQMVREHIELHFLILHNNSLNRTGENKQKLCYHRDILPGIGSFNPKYDRMKKILSMLIESCDDKFSRMFDSCESCGFGEFFVKFVSVYVKIWIATMTIIRFNELIGFECYSLRRHENSKHIFQFDRHHLDAASSLKPKRSPANMFRPKSSRYESRRMQIKHRNSLDSSDNLSDQLLHKRSNSLQSLNSVDNQNNIEERAKLSAKPRKIAWASRTCSEDKSYEDWTPVATATSACNSFEIIDRLEPCVEYKNKLEESKKKSIDIFLSRNFIDPVDILPSHRNPKLGLLRSFGTSSFATIGKHESDLNQDAFDVDQNSALQDDESISTEAKSEKKVTFAADLSKPSNNNSSAETRRMNFRNSYSKRYTTNFSFTSSRLERQTSVTKCPTPKAELKATMKRGNSLSLPENNDEESTTTMAIFRATSPSSISPPSLLFKQPVLPINQQQTEKMKQLSIKRKLKSCRSRSFHKSLDNSSGIENFDTFTFAKPLKSNQNSDVVTMVSLIVSNEEDNPATGRPQLSGKSDSPAGAKENVDNKLEKQNKTGILKSKWQAENIKRASTKPMQKRRFINVSHELTSSPEKNRTILTAVDNLIKDEKISLDASTSSSTTYNSDSQKNDTESESKKSESDKSFQTAKEQECWSSFRKMTNKGFSVSFDTILRGLLTPTEYRLRKSELSTQESP